MTTGQKIQALRKQRGLTQEQLAQRLAAPAGGVPLGAGRVRAAGDRQPASPGKVLGVSLDILLDPARGLEGPVPKEKPPPLRQSLPPPRPP